MTMPVQEFHTQHMSTARLESLADGVFAIVMTLMVFDLKPTQTVTAENIYHVLGSMWPNFLAFGVSFVLIGIYWVGHRAMLHHIRRADHVLHWVNLGLLAAVCLLPLSTRLVGQLPLCSLALTIYGVNLIVIGCLFYKLWEYATTNHRLVDHDLSAQVIRFGKTRCLLAPCVYVVAIALAYVNPWPTAVLYGVVPVLYIFPGLQQYWVRWGGLD